MRSTSQEYNNNNELEDNREDGNSDNLPTKSRSTSRLESHSRPLSKGPETSDEVEANIDENLENQTSKQSRSNSKTESHTRPTSEMEAKSRSESRNSEKSRPDSEASKSRPTSEASKSRPTSEATKSRPTSEAPKSRPTSDAPKSRPITQNEERSRPESQVNSTTRPNSKMVEFADQHETPDKSDSKTRPNSEIERPKSELKSRPPSDIKADTRPNSEMIEGNLKSGDSSKANTRPNSKMLEENDSFSNKSKSRPSTRPVSKKEHNNGPIIDGEGVIEGVINGEDEVERMNNEGINEPRSDDLTEETDEDIANLVASGNMEQMAALVLNGKGEKLLKQKSENPELQSFLENVPVYMVSFHYLNICVLKFLFTVQNKQNP